jgi:hypothetical protein
MDGQTLMGTRRKILLQTHISRLKTLARNVLVATSIEDGRDFRPSLRHPSPILKEEPVVQEKKKPAFDPDAILSKSLDQVSASDLLQALQHGGMGIGHLTVWPEKKKYELWVEPENLGKVDVGRLLDIIRGEKKKVEIEKHPGLEGWRDPWGAVVNPPDLRLDQLADRVAQLVEARLRR